VASTLYKILQEVPEPLWKVDPALPGELVSVVERSLAKLRDERYQDMASFRSDLEAIRHQQQLGTSTTPRPISASAASGPGTQHVTRLSDAPVVAPKTDDPLTPRGEGSAVPATTSRVSRRALTIAAAAILAAGLAGTWLFSVRHRQPAAVQMPAAPTERVEDPIAARIAAAQQALDRRDYAAAITAADAALLQAPQNADAQRIRGAARQAAVDDALRRGTQHLQTGATSDAIQAAGEALALSPDNAEARHILEQAATRTSAPDAETARRRMAEARAAAGAARADKHAAPAFRNASRAAQDADRLYKAKRFADAASRYYEASGLFHGAEAAARVATAPAPAAAEARPAPPAQATELSPPAPAPASPVPAAPPPQVTTPVAPPVSPPVPTSLPIAPPSAIPSPPPAAETPAAVAAEERITELLGRYKDALEARSIDQLKRIWPSFGGAPETALRQEFQHATRIAVEVAEPQISVSGNTGKAIFIRRYSVVTVEGQRLQSTSQAVMDVKRTGSGWVIEAIRFTLR
jgi:tetratricopeptide (TPR) repeat protein